MTDVSYSAGWVGAGGAPVPGRSARAMAREDREVAKAAAEAEAARSDRLEAAAFAAEQEGRDVSLAGAFARAQRSMAKTDYAAQRADLQAQVDAGEVEVLDGTVVRARDTYSRMDDQIRRAQALHDELVTYAVRHSYPATVEAARVKSAAGHLSRSAPVTEFNGPSITRVATPHGNLAWP